MELAPLIGTTQGILSRLELGIGGNMHILFNLVNFLNKSGFEGHLLFKDSFRTEVLRGKGNIILQVEAAEMEIKSGVEKLKGLLA